jgi:hypothetical protein
MILKTKKKASLRMILTSVEEQLLQRKRTSKMLSKQPNQLCKVEMEHHLGLLA